MSPYVGRYGKIGENLVRSVRFEGAVIMNIGNIVRTRPVPVLYGLMIASLVALLPLPPLLQDQAYHQFADQRELFGIPNFWNVVSNLPFIAVGAVGLLRFHRDATTARVRATPGLNTGSWTARLSHVSASSNRPASMSTSAR